MCWNGGEPPAIIVPSSQCCVPFSCANLTTRVLNSCRVPQIRQKRHSPNRRWWRWQSKINLWYVLPVCLPRSLPFCLIPANQSSNNDRQVIPEHKRYDNLPPITSPEFHASPEDIVTFEAHILSYKLLGSYALSADMQARIPELKPCQPDWPAKIEKIRQTILNAEYLVRDLYNEIDAANLNTGNEGEAKKGEGQAESQKVE